MNPKVNHPYTCAEYREEMMLLMLNRRLQNGNLSPEERREVEKQIRVLEIEMGMD